MKQECFTGLASLKRPFTEEEWTDVINEKDLIHRRDELVGHNIFFVVKIVNDSFKETGYETEELIQEGCIGLMKAANTFDATKDVKFLTYAKVCIENEILMYLRKMKKFKEVCILDEPYKTSLKEIITKKTLIADKHNYYLELEDDMIRKSIREVVYSLKGRELELVTKYFGFEGICYSQKELSREYSVSQSYISKLIIRTLEKIKLRLERKDIIDKNIKKLK